MLDLLKDRAQRGVAIESIRTNADNALRSLEELSGDLHSAEARVAYGGAVYLLEQIAGMADLLEKVEKRETDERLRKTLEGIRNAAESRGEYDLSDELDRVMGVE